MLSSEGGDFVKELNHRSFGENSTKDGGKVRGNDQGGEEGNSNIIGS